MLSMSAMPGFAQPGDQALGQKIAKLIEEAFASNRKDLAEGVSKSLNEGDLAQATKLLQEASHQGSTLPSAQALLQSLEQAKPQDVFLQGSITRDSLGRWHLVSLSATEQVQIRALDEMHVSWWRKTFVTRASQQFLQDVRYGMQNADTVIAACRARWSCLRGQKDLIEDFLKSATEDRVFVIGSGLDEQFVDEYRKAISPKKVFFYKDCATFVGQYCDKDLVGALMSKSGTCVMVDSTNAAKSEYVFPEVAATLRLRQGQSLMLMIPIEDVKTAARTANYAALNAMTVNVYTVSQQ